MRIVDGRPVYVPVRMTVTIDLTDPGVRDQTIRELLHDGLKQRDLARMFGITQQHVSRIAKGRTRG